MILDNLMQLLAADRDTLKKFTTRKATRDKAIVYLYVLRMLNLETPEKVHTGAPYVCAFIASQQ